MKKIAVVLTLAVAFCFVLAAVAPAAEVTRTFIRNNIKNKHKATSIPIWQITQDGTILSVPWVDATNPRFAVYDPSTPGDDTDDVVLDKETGLVWERSPSTTYYTWTAAISTAYTKYLGGRKGWRLPTIEELAGLVDMGTADYLPTGHPFINVQAGYYWSSTTVAPYTAFAWGVGFDGGYVLASDKSNVYYVWCVRGGPGHDAY